MASDYRLKEQLPELTEEIVATYTPDDAINHLGHCELPSYTAVTEILLDLKDVLYPGYRRKVGLHQGNIRYHVGGLLDSLHDQLSTQIARALRHEDRVEKNHSDCEGDIDFDALLSTEASLMPSLEYTLAPNPMIDTSELRLTNTRLGGKIQFYDSQGRMVLQRDIPRSGNLRLEHSSFASSGLYIYRITGEEFAPVSGKLLVR